MKTGGSGKGSASSMIIGASEPDPGAVAAAAKAAAAAERELDPPRLKTRGVYEAAEAAAEHAKVLKALYDDMEEQKAKITQLVDDNRAGCGGGCGSWRPDWGSSERERRRESVIEIYVAKRSRASRAACGEDDGSSKPVREAAPRARAFRHPLWRRNVGYSGIME